MTEYDPLAYAREKARKFEAEATMLRSMNEKLIRMLAILLDVAASGETIQTKLAVLEIADQMERVTPR